MAAWAQTSWSQGSPARQDPSAHTVFTQFCSSSNEVQDGVEPAREGGHLRVPTLLGHPAPEALLGLAGHRRHMPACCMEAVVSEVAAVDWPWLQAAGGLPGFDGEGKTGMLQSKLSAKSVVAARSFCDN